MPRSRKVRNDNMIPAKMERAKSDEERCTEEYKHGPCPYAVVENSNKCRMHGGHIAANAFERKQVHEYRVGRWEKRIREFAQSDEIKSIRQELGVMRMLLEETLNFCKDADDLMLHSTKIIAMADEINKLVITCVKVEDRLGAVIDKSAVINLGDQILKVIKDHVPPDKYELVAKTIINQIVTTNDPLDEETEFVENGSAQDNNQWPRQISH